MKEKAMKDRITAAWKVLRGELEAVEPCREAPPASRPISAMWVYSDTLATNSAAPANITWTST